ncbi:ArpU family phage packaging/lysis transcriptional regulator [Streptococcus thermophilus]|nr:autolysin [Streptococcus thermophilus]MCE2227843.1 autolysin [Streptococcus thermophilus]
MLLPEIDEKATIKRCKRKLREYPRWREIAHDSAEQKITQEFTFMPRGGGSVNKPVENIAVRRVDALNELEAIEQAVSGLYRPDYRRILIEKYLAYPPQPNWKIAQAIGFERTAFQELLNHSILAFAELYRDGQLVVER